MTSKNFIKTTNLLYNMTIEVTPNNNLILGHNPISEFI